MILLWLAVLLGLTGLLTMVEMGLFSVRRERLELAAKSGDVRGSVALKYLDDPPKFLTASNVLITLLSVVTGSLVQPGLTSPVSQALDGVLDQEWVSPLSYALAVTGLTIVSLVFSNLLPKQLGFVWAEAISLRFARFMQVYVSVAQPIAVIVEPAVRVLAKILRVPRGAQARVGEGDMLLLLEEGLRCGGLNKREQDIAKRAFALSDLRVDDVMTKRTDIEWIEFDLPPGQARQKVAGSKRSWLLVADDSLDRSLGVLKARDYLGRSAPPTRDELRAMLYQPATVRTGDRLLQALEALDKTDARVIIVLDPKGQVAGIATANDIVTALIGPVRSL